MPPTVHAAQPFRVSRFHSAGTFRRRSDRSDADAVVLRLLEHNVWPYPEAR